MSEEQSLPVDEGQDGSQDDLSGAFAEAFGTQKTAEPATTVSPPPAPSGKEGQQAVADEGEPAPPADDLEEVRKKAHGFDSMKGRLAKEQEELRKKAEQYEKVMAELRQAQEERKRVEEEIKKAEEQKIVQPPIPAAPAQPDVQMVEIPDEIRDEAEQFARDYPDLAPLLRYPGREGQRLRKLLADYGVDVASIHGNAVMAQYRLEQAEKQLSGRLSESEQRLIKQQEEMQARLENERRQAHYQQIYSAVPEYGAIAADPSKRQDLEQFHAALSEWVESKPHREATTMLEILKAGDAASVVKVLKQFQSEQSAGSPGVPSGNMRSAAHAAAAIPSRASSPPRGRADPNNEVAAFREAFG